MHHMDEEMRRCIDECLSCHRVCVTMVSQHCLDVGGQHVGPRHVRLMLACGEICRTRWPRTARSPWTARSPSVRVNRQFGVIADDGKKIVATRIDEGQSVVLTYDRIK